MLTSLKIKNFGLIEELSVDLKKGLNVFTGETGAGKSIVIDALRIALGERVLSSHFKNPSQKCFLEAVFQITDDELRSMDAIEDFLEDDEDQLIIQRTIEFDGSKKNKINGMNVTVGQLKALGQALMDFHGPHDHQLLFSKDSHLGILDRLIDFKELKNLYTQHFQEYSRLRHEIQKLKDLSRSRDKELDLLAYQMKELEQVSLSEEDYRETELEQTRINNAERLHENVQEIMGVLTDDQASSSEFIRRAFLPMKNLNQVDEQTNYLMDLLSQLQDLNDQLASEIHNYAYTLSYEEDEAVRVNDRFDMYRTILKKYGPTLQDARKVYEESKKQFELLSDLEHNDAKLQKALMEAESQLASVAKEITAKRHVTAKELKKTIERELKDLGFTHVTFETRFSTTPWQPTGCDEIEFFISPNAGMDPKALAEIVSSGEAARVMLALKQALIKVDPIPVLVFDEIDAQIGGRLGSITGQKLKHLSKHRQVLLITHLPQIAAFADHHLKVVKPVINGMATTEVLALSKDEKVKELAQMMSGQEETSIALKHAKDLLAKAG
ncbi:MAG: DNA repair protein RecN [Candidatus Omnitrophica bacterium]|nr:DNA repair protein RecN [Candidatus Omnitrophota bacterium]